KSTCGFRSGRHTAAVRQRLGCGSVATVSGITTAYRISRRSRNPRTALLDHFVPVRAKMWGTELAHRQSQMFRPTAAEEASCPSTWTGQTRSGTNQRRRQDEVAEGKGMKCAICARSWRAKQQIQSAQLAASTVQQHERWRSPKSDGKRRC